MRYAYWPGCTARGLCREIQTATLALAPLVCVELIPLATGDDPNSAALSPAQALETDLEILTACVTCSVLLGRASPWSSVNHANSKNLDAKTGHGGPPHPGQAKVLHLLDLLMERIGLESLKKIVYRPLSGLKMAGLVAGPSRMARVVALEGVIRTCGADFLPDTLPRVEPEPQTTPETLLHTMKEARKIGADCMVCLTPLCHWSADSGQPNLLKTLRGHMPLPVIHLSQMVGLAFGLEPLEQLGLGRSPVPLKNILERLRPSPLLGGDPILMG